jgi:hypothetical protein
MFLAPILGARDNDQKAGIPSTDLGHINLKCCRWFLLIKLGEQGVYFTVSGITDVPVSFESQDQILAASAEA